jgi:hypothetical protein
MKCHARAAPRQRARLCYHSQICGQVRRQLLGGRSDNRRGGGVPVGGRASGHRVRGDRGVIRVQPRRSASVSCLALYRVGGTQCLTFPSLG